MMSPSLPMRVIARSIGTESEEKSLTVIEHAGSFEWSNAALAVRLGIPPLADDGRSHPCGGRIYGLVFRKNRNGPVNESDRARESTPTERLRAMREYASAAGGLKAKG